MRMDANLLNARAHSEMHSLFCLLVASRMDLIVVVVF
jgi:hypothetical protein